MRKKILILFLVFVSNLSLFANDKDRPKPDFSKVIGNRDYIELLGGQYNKDGVAGIVFYISPDERYMLIIPLNDRIVGSYYNNTSYVKAKSICEKYGFRIPSPQELKILSYNLDVMYWNVTYEVGWNPNNDYDSFRIFPSRRWNFYWTTKRNPDGEFVVINPKYPEDNYHAPETSDVNEDGLNHLSFVGVKTVKFEPQYITGVHILEK